MMDRSRPPALPAAAVALLVTLAGCDSPVTPEASPADLSAAASRVGAHDGAVTRPFRARLSTDGQGLAVDPACGAPPRFLNTQVGEGEATHLGRFSVRITFCIDATAVLDDGQLTEGESLPYDDGVGTLIAANGDELHMEISGAVLPSSDPSFDFEFHDPFRFTGGTGRFAGASGEARTDSFVNQAADRTQHDWRGTLTLPSGR